MGIEPFYEERDILEGQEKAKMRAADKFKQLSRGTGNIGSLVIPGDPMVRAEMDLILQDFRPEICSLSPWIITQATHSFDRSGYKTTIVAEVKAK